MIRGTTSRPGLSRNPRATVSRVNGAHTRRLMFGVTPLCLRGSIALESVVASVVGNVRGTLLIICVTGVRVLRMEIGRMGVNGARVRRLMFGVTLLCLRASIPLESVVAPVVGDVGGALLIICVTSV